MSTFATYSRDNGHEQGISETADKHTDEPSQGRPVFVFEGINQRAAPLKGSLVRVLDRQEGDSLIDCLVGAGMSQFFALKEF